MTFGDALKATRRSIFQHGNAWRTAILCANWPQARAVFHETVHIMEAGSLEILEISSARMSLRMQGDSVVQVLITEQPERLMGVNWTSFIWMYGPDQKTQAIMRVLLRSPVLQETSFHEYEVRL